MATIYLKSGTGSDGNAGTSSASPKATLASAITAAGGGGTIYVDKTHSESQASALGLAGGGATSVINIICVDDITAGALTLATGATVATTGNNMIDFTGYFYVNGVKFNSGSGVVATQIRFGNNGSAWACTFDNCQLNKLGTVAQSAAISVGNSQAVNPSKLVLRNTTLGFGNVGDSIMVRCPLEWSDTQSAVTGTVPTTLFVFPSIGNATVLCRGVDLSALGSGKNIFNVGTGQPCGRLANCKLGSSVSVVTGTVAGFCDVDVVNSDSGASNTRKERYKYQGSIVNEGTIVRSGGASDGTTAMSRKMVSNANASFALPLVSDGSDAAMLWVNSTGSPVTATVEIVNDGTTLNDDEIWLEAEYLGSASYPVASIASDRKTDIVATAANQSSSSVTWTTTGLTTPVKQKLEVTFTPQMKGPVYLRVYLAKASQTVYFDPAATGVITNGRSYQADGLFVNEPQAGSGGSSGYSRSRIVNAGAV